MSEQRLERVAGPAPGRIWQIAMVILAAATVVVTGVVLGRVLLSQDWTLAVTVVGLRALLLALLIDPVAGLLLCVLLAPFGQFIHLTLQFGRGIPALDVTRLTAVFLSCAWSYRPLGSHTGTWRQTSTAAGPDLARSCDVPLRRRHAPLRSCVTARPDRWRADRHQFHCAASPVLLFRPDLVTHTKDPSRDDRRAGAGRRAHGHHHSTRQITGVTTFSPVAYSLIYEGKIRKVLSLFRSPATMASTLAVLVPLLLYGVQRASTWGKRLLMGAALVSVLTGVFLAYVRGGWLAAVLGIAILVVLSPRMRRALVPVIPLILIAALLLSGISLVNPEALESRLTSEQPITYRLRRA